MSSGSRPDLAPDRRSLALAVVAACTLMLGGCITLLGYVLDVPSLSDWDANGTAVQPNTAVALLACGVALLALSLGRMRVAMLLGAAIGLLAVTVGIEYAFAVDLGIDRLLLFGRTWGQATALAPGRIGPPAVLSLVLLAAAFVLLSVAPEGSPRARLRRWVPPIGLIVVGISVFTLVGYAFGGRAFYSVPGLAATAWQSALLLMVAAFGVLCAVPERDPVRMLRERSGAGMLARLALPMLVAVLIVIPALRQMGEDLRLYDEGTGRALSVVLTIGSSAGLMWWALTALRRREHRERERTALLRAVSETTSELIFVKDREARLTFANPAVLRALGVEEARAIGSDLSDILADPAEARAIRDTDLRIMASGSSETLEERLTSPEGTRFFQSTKQPLRDELGQVVGLIGVARDDTDRKYAEQLERAAERAVRQSEERFRSLVSVIADVPWTSDAEGRFDAPQPAWARFTGQDFATHAGLGWADALHPDDRERIALARRQSCASKDLFCSSGRLWHAGTQAYRHVEIRATPVLDEDGSVREWVGTCTDVHERIHAEEELRDANRRKDEFLATLAHELRNPLSPVRSSLDVLRTPDADPAARARVVDMMERQVSHMVRLVDDLLEVSRITRGKIELRKEVVDMAAIVRSALETVGPAIEKGRHRVVVDLPTDPLSLEGDPVRLTQIVANLSSNAAKYTEEGGEIRVTLRREADAAVVSVRDTGVGIPAEMLPRVFDLFTQVDRTLGRAQGGLGIGLALVERLVQMHGGSVQAKSEGAGRGSEFVVRLPFAHGDARVPAAPAPATPPLRSPERLPKHSVLVVDDNRDAADSLAILFGALGLGVHTAYDGPSGLAAVRALRPAVVFLDIGMPGMDGYEVATEVRRDAELREVTLVALTGWGSEEDRRRSRDAGFDHHLVKPVDVGTLERVLAGVERLRASATPGIEESSARP